MDISELQVGNLVISTSGKTGIIIDIEDSRNDWAVNNAVKTHTIHIEWNNGETSFTSLSALETMIKWKKWEISG